MAREKKVNDPSYDYVCFTELAYEFQPAQQKDVEKKIKQRLKYYGLGPFDAGRIAELRKLKNELSEELHNPMNSVFYRGNSGFALMENFDVPKMTRDYGKQYPGIPESDLTACIGFAVYLYYMR